MSPDRVVQAGSGFGRLARAGAIATALGALMVVLAAAPASAHGVGGIQPTNYRTTVAPMHRQFGAWSSASVDLGNRLRAEQPHHP